MKTIEMFNQELAEACKKAFPDRADDLVFGEGPVRPKLMLIGEAPGEQETLRKRPFVGKAGKNLDEFLLETHLERMEIYISNTVKIRPTKTGKSGRISNRPPDKEELAFFTPWLNQEIRLIRPEILAALGNTPLHALAGKDVTIGQVHGTMVPLIEGEGTLFALYHPASLIYNPSLKETYKADLALLASLVHGIAGK